jgi:exonuclease III
VCKISLKGKFHNIPIISAYAPTEDAEELDKDKFYDELDSLNENINRHDMLFIMGDFNAKIGREAEVKGVAGINSLHPNTSENGRRIISIVCKINYMLEVLIFPERIYIRVHGRHPRGPIRTR